MSTTFFLNTLELIDIHAYLEISDPRPMHEEVVKIDERIKSLEEELENLRIRRDQVLSDRALINRIPSEILSRIFELAAHEDPQLASYTSLVSRNWRTLSLETPQLWSYVRLDSTWYGIVNSLIRKIRVHMERAGAAKISVDLDLRYCETLDDARLLMSELKSHLNRCFSLRIRAQDWEWLAVAASACAEGRINDSLESVTLRVEPSDDGIPIPLLSGYFPRLEKVVLEQTSLTSVFHNTQMPALRVLHIVRDSQHLHHHHSHDDQARVCIRLRDYLNALTCSEILEDARLQSITFNLDGMESLFSRTPIRIPVPMLTDIALSSVDGANIALLFDAVSLPSLVRLAVQINSTSSSSEAYSGGDPLGWLARLTEAAHSGRLPLLRHFELRSCPCLSDGSALVALVRALHALPRLEALGFATPPGATLGEGLFEVLAGPGRTGDWLVPNLKVLSIGSGCRDVTGHEILRVVQARETAASAPRSYGGLDLGVEEVGFSPISTSSLESVEFRSVRRPVRLQMVRLAPCFALAPDVVEQLRMALDELRIVSFG